MKRIFLAIALTAPAAFAQLTNTTVSTTTNTTSTLTSAQRQQITQNLMTQHSQSIQTYILNQAKSAYEMHLSKASSSIQRQADLKLRMTKTPSRSYTISSDPNTGQLVVSPAPNPTAAASTPEISTTRTEPGISSLSTTDVSPNVNIQIFGSGFGGPVGPMPQEVRFNLAPGVTKVGLVDFWSDSAIEVSIPDVSGVYSNASATLYVVSGPQQSNLVTFKFTPEIESKEIPIAYQSGGNAYSLLANDVRLSCGSNASGPQDSTYVGFDANTHVSFVFARHTGGAMFGCADNDLLLQGKKLGHEWTVDYYLWSVWLSSGDPREANAYIDVPIAGTGVGTNDPTVKVHWVATANDEAEYSISVFAKGPKGTSF